LVEGRDLNPRPFEIAGDHITHIWAILNPEKLRPWATG
jgi:hypothetical protein